jgi:predicted nuclease of restriction endonuclease-like RecB superfamily
MLPLPLLRVRTRKGKITPQFCSENELELAKKVIGEFEIALKKKEKRGLLVERTESLESKYDFKLVRGLCTLLERRCVFKSTSSLDSVFVRRAVFEEASKRGFALTDFERIDIINSVASKIGATASDVEEAIWSDFEDNMVLEQFVSMDANKLLAWYNLSLMQTLLFNCTKFEFSVHGGANWKHVLRDVKRYGVMYYLQQNENNELTCALDGPLSLFKLTDRYGTSIAKLLPSIIASGKWSVKAWIVRKTMSGKKVLEFEMSDTDVPSAGLSSPYIEQKESESIYDSGIEEKFARKFEQFANGWKLVREPDPVIAEDKALIPDFMFEKYNRRVYLEIVGFWTKEYLERKLQKLIASTGKSIDMLIAVNEELACAKLSSLPKDKIILYRNEVPIRPIIDHLKKIDTEMIEQSTKVQIKVDSTKEIIPIEKIAQEYNIPEESALKILADNDQYIIAGRFLVSKIKTHKLGKMLEGVTKFIDACSLLAQNSIPESCHAELISKLGYDVVWDGLDTRKATLVKHGWV